MALRAMASPAGAGTRTPPWSLPHARAPPCSSNSRAKVCKKRTGSVDLSSGPTNPLLGDRGPLGVLVARRKSVERPSRCASQRGPPFPSWWRKPVSGSATQDTAL